MSLRWIGLVGVVLGLAACVVPAPQAAVVVTSHTQLPGLVGQRVELVGVVSPRTKCPYVHGVDLWELDGLRGRTVRVTGVLRQYVVTQDEIDEMQRGPGGPLMVAHRGPGTSYRLEGMRWEVMRGE